MQYYDTDASKYWNEVVKYFRAGGDHVVILVEISFRGWGEGITTIIKGCYSISSPFNFLALALFPLRMWQYYGRKLWKMHIMKFEYSGGAHPVPLEYVTIKFC